MTAPTRSADFERTFLAMRYFWGARGPSLTEGLAGPGLRPAAAALLAGLRHAERSERAKALSLELARLAEGLDQRGLWP